MIKTFLTQFANCSDGGAMSKNILCKLGFHEWIYYPNSFIRKPKICYDDMRICVHCGRAEAFVPMGKFHTWSWYRVENNIKEQTDE